MADVKPCAFCQIVSGSAPSTVVAEWPDAVAIVPLGPVVPGHMLVISRSHVRDFTVDPEVTARAMTRAAELAARLGGPIGQWNLITSAGAAATQTVWHLHVHLVPRAAGDGLTLPWTPTVGGSDA